MGDYFFLNGKIIPASQAMVNITDLALLRGYGIFDFLRTYSKTPFLIDRYLNRFFNSADHLGLQIPYSKEKIKEIIHSLLNKNNIFEAGIRMVLTGGYTSNGYTPADPNFFILIEKINFPTKENYGNGIKLYFFEHQRELSFIKSINYLSPISLRNKIQAADAYDVLYHFNGKVREVSRSNFFIVKDTKLITPVTDILLGITRASVIKLAGKYYQVDEREVAVKELWDADEAFMTGTTKKVLPVVRVDEHKIGRGVPGPVTKHLMELYGKFENHPSS